MLDKIGHIKNPLTVIAMFAGLAEVSGTAVLPFVGQEAQLFYVKFLSLFPCLIVGLFFYTLWKYPRNLYAPSDYSNENNFVSALGFLVAKKTEQEIEDAGVQLSAAAPMADAAIEATPTLEAEDAVIHDSSPSSKDVNEQQPSKQSEASKEASASVIRRVRFTDSHSQLFDRINQSTSWALRRLTSENNISFVKNVSPSGQPGIVFDAVGNENGYTIVVEIKYASSLKFNTISFKKSIRDACAYYDTLPEERRRKFGMILAVVAGDELNPDEVKILERRLLNRVDSENIPFTTQAKVFTYRELSDAYSTN